MIVRDLRNILQAGRLRVKPMTRIWVGLIVCLIPAIILGLAVSQTTMDPKWLFVDFLTAAEEAGACCHVAYGSVSLFGVIIWTGTAAIALFSAAILRQTQPDVAFFALIAGLFTAWLGIDDAFLLHEFLLPVIGIPEKLIYVSYLAFAAAYIGWCFRVIAASEIWLLALAGSGLAGSILIDAVLQSFETYAVVAEDSLKLFGICAWAAYHILTFAKAIMAEPADS